MFGFVEENANTKGTSGGRFINATVTAGQTFFIPQGRDHTDILVLHHAPACMQHCARLWLHIALHSHLHARLASNVLTMSLA